MNLVFNTTSREKARGLDKYTTDEEIVSRLRELGIDYDDIIKYCRLESMDYIAALLRYIDDRIKMGFVDDIKKYTQKGLPYGKYDVNKYMIEL